MVSNLRFQDFKYMSAALNGSHEAWNPADDFYGTVIGGTTLFGGGTLAFKGGAWLWSNRGNYASAWQQAKANAIYKAGPQKLYEGNNYFQNLRNRYSWNNIINIETSLPQKVKFDADKYDALKTTEEKAQFKKDFSMAKKKDAFYNNARTELNKIKAEVKAGTLKGKALRTRLAKLDNLINKADLNIVKGIQKGTIKPVGKFAKLKNGINKYTGMNALNKTCLEAATENAGKGGAKAITARMLGKTGSKFIKGGGPLTFAIEMGFEVPEIYETYQKLGAGAGTKQLLKSTTVCAASAAGFWAGGALGAKAGAAIGTCIGGPVGTAIGGAVGFIAGIGLGLLGSWAGRKGAQALVGKSELEKAQDAENTKAAIDATMNKEKAEVLVEAYEKMVAQREAELAQSETTQET